MYTAVGKKKQLLLALTSITDCMENCTSAHATTRVYSCRTWLEFGQYESGIQQISSLFHSFPFSKSSSKMFEDEAEDMAGQESGDSMSDLTEDDLDFDSDGITYIFDSDFCRTFYKNNSWIEASYLCDDNNQEQDITKDYLLDEFDLVTETLQTSPSHKDIISRLNTLPQIVQLCNDHVFKEPFCGNRDEITEELLKLIRKSDRHTTEAYRNAIRNNIVEVLSSVLKIISFLSEESQELLTFDAHGIRLQHTKKDIRQALASIPCHRIFEILKTMDLQLHDQALLTLTTIFTHVKDRKQQQHLFIFLNNLARYNNNMIQKLIVNDVVPFIFSWIDVTCEHFHPPTEVFHTIVVCGTNKQVNELIKRENVFKEACELITGCHDYEVIKYLLLALNVIVQKCKQLPKLKKKLKGDVLDAIDTTMEYYRGYGDKGPDVAKFRKFLETGRIKKK
ncbi:uncharacterized protein TRIADDRAFT_54146 [Trichoplax adhaerens]|uniref:Uncharacterized protein n=1 Tax=Trichoplax adhaerens TaxID=10228 RepID=B3RR86_TRIAD|nr:predicted protein [Trichoplax adhaerens]EDV26832.1 predicted protein [Trichoplax adhaerens]|eukprot:XP_002110828.1 predicted protein [Trichoplax adhaerens]